MIGKEIDLFVPGRVCLFGEHSDWAGSYRRFNSAVLPGRVIIAGVNQGVYARAAPCPDRLIVHSTLPDGTRQGPAEFPMDSDTLLEVARQGGFFSYAAGVALYMKEFYGVGGLRIDNYKTDLPVKKGLSSSAAFCVLAARAFNRVYGLHLTTRAEMEAAYQGEILTPSRCGRMDQGCAFGRTAVLMIFDGDRLDAHPLHLGGPLYLLIADLKGQKDTIRILADLNKAYPFAEDEIGKRVQEYLGPVNTRIVEEARKAIEAGDARRVGELMTEAQAAFDEAMIPACPDELTAPKLHAVLADEHVQRYVWGGKGVGSQGDGSVQFVARSREDRKRLREYLEQSLGLTCFDVDLLPPTPVRKALIPAAGMGTRMFPATKALKKELFPVVTPDGVAKPALMLIIEELVGAGLGEIGLIVRPEDRELFEDFFQKRLPPATAEKLPARLRRIGDEILELGRRLYFVHQETQEGFGHAVWCVRDWVGDEPFLLTLGDHLFAPEDDDVPCARQLLNVFEEHNRTSVVALCIAPAADVVHYGTVRGEWIDRERGLLQVAEFVEKPSVDYARANLVTEGLPPDHFLCIYGQYVLTPRIFEALDRMIRTDAREAGEFQLTTALDAVRREEGVLGLIVRGKRFDIGLPEAYVRTIAEYSSTGVGSAASEPGRETGD